VPQMTQTTPMTQTTSPESDAAATAHECAT
jgi:hypothetical protein